MKADNQFDILCNAVALIYHEGRNVRHLIHQGFVDPQRWRYVMSLPTNRDDAWRKIAPIRLKALSAGSVDVALRIFESHFHVSLQDLGALFSNKNWRHAKLYGGNAWAVIVDLTATLADRLRMNAAPDETLGKLISARHNTGLLFEKLSRLEKARARYERGP